MGYTVEGFRVTSKTVATVLGEHGLYCLAVQVKPSKAANSLPKRVQVVVWCILWSPRYLLSTYYILVFGPFG